MATSTVENYLKQLYLEQQATPGLVAMGRLASLMGVVPGTATTMVKALADSGLVNYEPRTGTQLTPAGQQLALHVLRRHRLVELFLVKVLNLDWSEVHEEAEELEHAISDKVLDRIDTLLGHPAADPHGDPIPSAAGDVQYSQTHSLADCELHQPMRISRVVDQGASFLQFIERCGLRPGTIVRVLSRDPQADATLIHPENREVLTLGTTAAAKLRVETI
ncbi:MAG TPA: metal-dependent transcriptional regulator [Tepidisphaeraceae bacterium]|jgi:DtxR family Mn-dependent transcriptional regulator|nr:metal-dependent transcriptional regulator [Tepidisphaeraceae bacterium]